ncbi:MAG TPA: M3 family oligoendopeptidase [Candidatus Dormibacteraeota bacterium]|nr:M3 family oligoendopeptidase [Candidatus Dormibacteraeota bacterium]
MATTTTTETGAEEIHWDLSHIYQGDARQGIDADLLRAQELTQGFETRYRGAVAGLDAAAMTAALRELEAIHEVLGRAAAYAFLDFSIDVADPARGALLQKVQESMTQTGARLLFFSLEWLAVADDAANRLLASPEMEGYRHYLQSARRYRPYVLSEGEERVLAEKSVTARSSWDRLFEEVTTAVRVRIGDGEVTLDEALSKLHDGDPQERRTSAQAVTDALRGGLPVRKFVLNTILADKSIDDRLRSYPHWIADRNLANEASDESVQALIEAVTSRYDIPHRYFALKKKLLGLDTLYDWDRYAPLDSAEPQVSWDEAREIVLDAYGSFSPRMRELGSEFFDKNWIDAALGPNKRGGAYAHQAIPSLHPYVFINFTGKRRDVLVLAHELGHGVHMSLSRAQTYLNLDTPLTTAETASIFGETVTFSRLLEAEREPERRLGLMVGRIDDATASIFRQVAMNRFEDTIHNQRRASGELSEEDLNSAWLRTQRDMLGPAVEVSDNYGIWWSYIPHFIGAPGYVYAYAFGNLLALAIYQRAVEEGPGFAPKYFELLSAGGSDSPEALTAKLGVDLSDPAFWEGGLNQISTLVDEAEALSEKR